MLVNNYRELYKDSVIDIYLCKIDIFSSVYIIIVLSDCLIKGDKRMYDELNIDLLTPTPLNGQYFFI